MFNPVISFLSRLVSVLVSAPELLRAAWCPAQGGRKDSGGKRAVRTLAFFRIVGHLFSICRCHKNITATPKSGGFRNFALCATFIVEMTVTIPSERLANITLNERDALVDIAIGLYKREQVSLGRAAEISGLSSPEFSNELGRRRIPINYEAKDLRVDLDTLNNLS